MIVDELNIFPKIAQRFKKDFKDATFFIKGSRLGLYKGKDYDFDVVINIPNLTRIEYIRIVKSYMATAEPIRKEFLSMTDEFGSPVKVDVSFTQDRDTIESWREIKI